MYITKPTKSNFCIMGMMKTEIIELRKILKSQLLNDDMLKLLRELEKL